MTVSHESESSQWVDGMRLLAQQIDFYSVVNGRFEESDAREAEPFLSRSMLKSRRWVVFPLWEANLAHLIFEDRSVFNLLGAVADQALQRGCLYFYWAGAFPFEGDATPEVSAWTFGLRRVHLASSPRSEAFWSNPTRAVQWAHNFYWPDDQKFIVYTDGDNAGFIASDRTYLEHILKLSFSYCESRLISAPTGLPKWHQYIEPYLAFCREFS